MWWSRFEKDLYKFVDTLIGTLLGALCVAGLVALGVLAGPATLLAGLIGLVVAIVFGLVCDGFDFSPTKFFMDLIGKSILAAAGELLVKALDVNAQVAGVRADKEIRVSKVMLLR